MTQAQAKAKRRKIKRVYPVKVIELEVVDIIRKQVATTEVVKAVNNFMLPLKPEIKAGLAARIQEASKVDWGIVSGGDSFGITRAQRLEKSFNWTKRVVSNHAQRARAEQIRLLDHYVSGRFDLLKGYGIGSDMSEAEALDAITNGLRSDLKRSITKTLESAEDRLVRTEAKSIWHEKFIEKHGEDKVIWVGSSDACPICKPLIGTRYDRAIDAPMIPVHANCRCSLEVIA